jgi:hypothetical protein
MRAGRGLAAALAVTVSLPSCGDSSAPACDALLRASRNAMNCDPALEPLVLALEQQPDELACRIAVRRVLEGPRKIPARVRSVWASDPPPDGAPLSAEELAALDEAAWPAELHIVPDVAPGPGVPPTSAKLDDLTLSSNEHGHLRGHLPPGDATIRVRHAGRETEYCVTLRPCQPLRITSHADKVARHPDVRHGPC